MCVECSNYIQGQCQECVNFKKINYHLEFVKLAKEYAKSKKIDCNGCHYGMYSDCMSITKALFTRDRKMEINQRYSTLFQSMDDVNGAMEIYKLFVESWIKASNKVKAPTQLPTEIGAAVENTTQEQDKGIVLSRKSKEVN